MTNIPSIIPEHITAQGFSLLVLAQHESEPGAYQIRHEFLLRHQHSAANGEHLFASLPIGSDLMRLQTEEHPTARQHYVEENFERNDSERLATLVENFFAARGGRGNKVI